MSRTITSEPLDLAALLAETDDPACGGLAVFAGTVREQNEGRAVSGMSYEAHPVLAAQTIETIEREVLERFDVRRCRVQHRIGALGLGEVSVLVVVRSPHRGPAFDAARYAIDELKVRTPIWKHEHYIDGESSYLDGVSIAADQAGSGDDHA